MDATPTSGTSGSTPVEDPRSVYAIDFETYYNSKDKYSLRGMPPYAYCHDRRFDAYLVSIYGADYQYVGNPKYADWSKLHGKTLVAHNAAFDGMVLKTLFELGIVKPFEHRFEDTADMAAYLLAPRNLAGASAAFLGIHADKQIRAEMDGIKYEDLDADTNARMQAYALKDSELCWK